MEIKTKVAPDGRTYKISANGMWFNIQTPDKVVEEIDKANISQSKIFMRYGDGVTGKDWMDEYDVCGKVGCSTGVIRIPLILTTSRSRGGCGILTHCIVRLMVNGREVYRHPEYKIPQFTVELDNGEDGELVMNPVKVECANHIAHFKSMKAAERYVAFMQGKRIAR